MAASPERKLFYERGEVMGVLMCEFCRCPKFRCECEFCDSCYWFAYDFLSQKCWHCGLLDEDKWW